MLSWQQPQSSGVLRTVEMPCPEGCGGAWTHPRAERDRVVGERQASPAPACGQGNTEQANRIGAEFIRDALEGWGFLGDRPRAAGDEPGRDR